VTTRPAHSVLIETDGWLRPLEVWNESGLDDSTVMRHLPVEQAAAEIMRWTSEQRSTRGGGSMFARNTFVASDNPYEQMRIARDAMRDDVVGGVADITEALAFQRVGWEAGEEDEVDVFNQLARDLNLDDFVRKVWRELYTYSQTVVATWWAVRTYRVRGESDTGVKRKKEYTLLAPTAVSVLDPTKIVPVGNPLFGQERLCWIGTEEELRAFRGVGANGTADPTLAPDALMDRLLLGQYTPSRSEAEWLTDLGVDPDRLLEFDPRYTWRHTLTRPDYQRFPDVRLADTFRHLDLKRQLMDADRVQLVGAANYILLIKKGTDAHPGQPVEIENLRENYSVLAKLPVIIGDHRLSIEIITPKLDTTLQSGRYDLLDRRIRERCIGTFTLTDRADKSLLQGRVIARLIESRRWMIKRTVEARIGRMITEANPDQLTSEPNLIYRPRNVALEVDPAVIEALLKLRTMGELSRETELEELGFDQDVEAQRRKIEERRYDATFRSAVPHSSPATNPIGPPAQGQQGQQGQGQQGQQQGADPNPQVEPRPNVNRGRPRINPKPEQP